MFSKVRKRARRLKLVSEGLRCRTNWPFLCHAPLVPVKLIRCTRWLPSDYSTTLCDHLISTMLPFDSIWKSSIPVFFHMKPVDSVPTNSGCQASPPNHAELEHRGKLCAAITLFAWLRKNDPARSEQGKPSLVGSTSVLPCPHIQMTCERRLLLAMTGRRRRVGTTVVLHCRSLRERMTARIKGGHVQSL